MKNSILIIETNEENKLSELIIKACADKPMGDINLYVAKNAKAASKILGTHQDIAAILNDSSGVVELAILNNQDSEIDWQEIIEELNSATDEDGVTKITLADSAISNRASKTYKSATFEDVLSILSQHNLLKAEQSAHCNHEKVTETLLENKFKIKALEDKILYLEERIFDELKSLREVIDSCPLKKDLIKNALKSNKQDKKPKDYKAVIVAIISLVGVLITASLGLLSDLFKLLFKYLIPFIFPGG